MAAQLVENHAYDSYTEFAEANKELLATMPAPAIAREYYSGPDVYYFEAFMTRAESIGRKPPVNNLHDVFVAIRDDEYEHIKTMHSCADGSVTEQLAEKKAKLAGK